MKRWFKFPSLLPVIMLMLAVVISSCESDEPDSQIAVNLTGIDNGEEVFSGEVLQIKVFAQTTSASLSSMKVSTYSKDTGGSVIEERNLSGTKVNEVVYYTVPYIEQEESKLTVSVSVTDCTGYTRTVERSIKVLRRDEPLENRSGVVLYCDADSETQPDGYCFSEMRPIIEALVAPELVDLYIPDVDEMELPDPADAPTIINQWRTKTDLNFARSSSFDFSAATSLTIASAYEASIRASRISMLRAGDIVLVGRGAKALGVIQIVDMIDGGSLEKSRYILNIKAIKANLAYDAPVSPENPGSSDDPVIPEDTDNQE